MAQESKPLSSEESLEIITHMIQAAKGNVKGSSFHFLLWGWVVVVANLGHFYLMEFTSYEHPYIVWLITIPTWVISFIYGYRSLDHKNVKTYSDGLVMWCWLAFTFSIVIIIFSGKFGHLIPPTILVFAGFAVFMSGLILKFKPLILGGSSFWVFSPVAFHVAPSYALLVSAVAIFTGYLIPGYMLRAAS